MADIQRWPGLNARLKEEWAAMSRYGPLSLKPLRRRHSSNPLTCTLGTAAVFVGATAILMMLDIPQLAPLAAVALCHVFAQEFCNRRRSNRSDSGSGQLKSCRKDTAVIRQIGSPAVDTTSDYPHKLTKQDSKVPVLAPTFESHDFNEQVGELLELITPTATSEKVAQKLAECAKRAILPVFPEVEVSGIASGDVIRGTAFGVAVPELDIVATAAPHALTYSLQSRLAKGGLSMAKLDARKLQKSAIRVCTDQLVSAGGFKFRRSAFRGQEPKVTLMAPPALGGSDKSIPLDFSVNAVTPLYNSVLTAECGSIDLRAKSLILVVRRWAKDRGISHAAKGHLPPYSWTLLAIYFLQVAFGEEPILPPLRGYRMVNRMTVRRDSDDNSKTTSERWEPPESNSAVAQLSVGNLLQSFMRFYSQDFDFQTEIVSVRQAWRSKSTCRIVKVSDSGSQDAGQSTWPSIEDPFEPTQNLAAGSTPTGIARLREEFSRACDLIDRTESLSVLLEPWAPGDKEDESQNIEGCNKS